MSELNMMVTVSDRNQIRRFILFYKEFGLKVTLLAMGRGTAANDILSDFGLEATEKAILFTFVTGEEWRTVRTGLQKQMMIDIPGSGIAFIVPLSSVGGRKQLQYLLAGRAFEVKEESALKDTKYELLIVISNQGYVDQIMDAARSAQAPGGTVIHAKGTGTEAAEKFLGVSLAAEKEMIFMVVRRESKNGIMKAIMEKAGLNSEAKAVVFSLPVTETAGMRLLEME